MGLRLGKDEKSILKRKMNDRKILVLTFGTPPPNSPPFLCNFILEIYYCIDYHKNMIIRHISNELLQLLQEYPVVTLLGPRQAGKTTLAKGVLNTYEYTNLEQPEIRQFASDDPKAFLRLFRGNVILDEIQRVPELLSYIQVEVDNQQRNGQFVITGSHQLSLREAITQSLAGRTGILNLYPFSILCYRSANVKIFIINVLNLKNASYRILNVISYAIIRF